MGDSAGCTRLWLSSDGFLVYVETQHEVCTVRYGFTEVNVRLACQNWNRGGSVWRMREVGNELLGLRDVLLLMQVINV